MDEIILVGYGGHAKSVADCIERSGQYHIIGYTDQENRGGRYKYLGSDEVLPSYLERGCIRLAMGIGYLGRGQLREELYRQLKGRGFLFPGIVDPSAVVSSSAQIGEGSFIGKNVVVNAEAVIGRMCIINTKAVVEHESIVEDFAHVAVGAVLCGQVRVGRAAFIGANATIIQGIEVEERMVVPAGETVRRRSVNRRGGDK